MVAVGPTSFDRLDTTSTPFTTKTSPARPIQPFVQAATRDERVLVPLDLDFANPFRFPPEHTTGIVVLRVQNRPGRSELDTVVERLIDGLERADPKAHLWIVEPSRIRQYESSGEDEEADHT